MVDLHKQETYNSNMWHIKLWLFITEKTTLGNLFGAYTKNSWCVDKPSDCIPKSFCAYWWGLIGYFTIQLPIMLLVVTLLSAIFIVNPIFNLVLWFYGDVNILAYGNASKDFIIEFGTTVLILYCLLLCIGILFIIVGFIIKKNIIEDACIKTYDFVADISMFHVVGKLYAAHKEKYCPTIKIEILNDDNNDSDKEDTFYDVENLK